MNRLVVNFWNDVRFRWRRPAQLFQNHSATALDRYPLLFRYVQTAVGRLAPVRILSFGCSTGEEVETLRAYFPAARIKGLDINPFNIAACRRRFAGAGDADVAFEVADSARGEPADFYDVVFCLAVLRRSGLRRRETCLPDISFEQFERGVDELARSLRPGGLLALRHASFRFSDTAVARSFDIVLTRPMAGREPVLFGADNMRLRGAREDALVFRKRRI